jgi:hypothetical protein
MALNKAYTFTNNTIADPAEENANHDAHVANVRAAHHRDADGTKISYQDIATGWGLVPSGGIMFWYSTIASIPTGYVFCNGANGTPDMRNRFAMCPGQDSGGTYDTGDTGGAATHQLLESEMPSHTHVQDSHNHQIAGAGSGANLAGTNLYNWGTGYPDRLTAGTVATNQNTGGGGAHNNMPPYKALVFIMKT